MSARQRQAALPAHATRCACSSLAQSTPATALSAFPSMVSELKGSETVLTGLLADRPALFGVVAHFEALGLELLELRQIRARPHRVNQAMTAPRMACEATRTSPNPKSRR
jgi:hypothetical protein